MRSRVGNVDAHSLELDAAGARAAAATANNTEDAGDGIALRLAKPPLHFCGADVRSDAYRRSAFGGCRGSHCTKRLRAHGLARTHRALESEAVIIGTKPHLKT